MLLKEVLFFETSFDLICHEDRGSFREGGLRRCHLSRTALAGAAWHLYMCAVGWGEEQALRRSRGARCGRSPPGGVSVPREGPGALSGRALLPVPVARGNVWKAGAPLSSWGLRVQR